MDINNIIENFNDYNDMPSIVWNDKTYSYGFLNNCINENIQLIKSLDIKIGTVVALEGDFSPTSIGLFFSLIKNKCIIVPINRSNNQNVKDLYKIAAVEFLLTIDDKEKIKTKRIGDRIYNDLYNVITTNNDPGLVLFTSGTSGVPKAAVHNFSKLLDKFKIKRQSLRTLNFLLFDHWGGLNTMFHILSNGGTLISVVNRSPSSVCKLIEKHRIELLPVSPTFLNLLLVSKEYKNYDLTSLKIISYGTEPMPEITLKRLNKTFPQVKLLQTYGLIELGVLQSKSKKQDSLWVKVGGEGYQTRIVDGILQIKAESAMIGYLNADSPFTDDGWFITGDKVLKKGEYIKILGRKSEIINVGGEKVYPQEVENIILELEEVSDVTVFGEKNPITGNIVCARLKPINEMNKRELIKSVKTHCSKNLQPYKVPIKILIDYNNHHGDRFKKSRGK